MRPTVIKYRGATYSEVKVITRHLGDHINVSDFWGSSRLNRWRHGERIWRIRSTVTVRLRGSSASR
jgi:hypothetical protein